jgi:hypothetical protein
MKTNKNESINAPGCNAVDVDADTVSGERGGGCSQYRSQGKSRSRIRRKIETKVRSIVPRTILVARFAHDSRASAGQRYLVPRGRGGYLSEGKQRKREAR